MDIEHIRKLFDEGDKIVELIEKIKSNVNWRDHKSLVFQFGGLSNRLKEIQDELRKAWVQ